MKRRDFLKGVAVLPVVAVVPALPDAYFVPTKLVADLTPTEGLSADSLVRTLAASMRHTREMAAFDVLNNSFGDEHESDSS